MYSILHFVHVLAVFVEHPEDEIYGKFRAMTALTSAVKRQALAAAAKAATERVYIIHITHINNFHASTDFALNHIKFNGRSPKDIKFMACFYLTWLSHTMHDMRACNVICVPQNTLQLSAIKVIMHVCFFGAFRLSRGSSFNCR